MGIFTSYTCDAPNCKEVKKETNDWFLFNDVYELTRIDNQRHSTDITTRNFVCIPLEGNERLVQKGYKVLCSVSCAQKVFESFLRSTIEQHNEQHNKQKGDNPTNETRI
jgi:hypothetical protein